MSSTPEATHMPAPPSKTQVATRLAGALAAVALFLFLQLYLMTTSIRAWMAGDLGILLPAALCSLVLFSAVAGITWWSLRAGPSAQRGSPHGNAHSPA